MAPKIVLYVDTVSPFAYIAYYMLRHDPVFSKCDITYVPILLGGVMKACGNTAPIKIKNKDKWIEVERLRWSSLFSIPMNPTQPPNYPPLTLPTMRALAALTAITPSQETLCIALDALFSAFWVHHRESHKPKILAEVLKEALGEDLAKIIMESLGKEGKEILARNTDRALADEAFGLPWFVATDEKGKTECFWGVDHIGQVSDFLGLEKPRTGGWKAML